MFFFNNSSVVVTVHLSVTEVLHWFYNNDIGWIVYLVRVMIKHQELFIRKHAYSILTVLLLFSLDNKALITALQVSPVFYSLYCDRCGCNKATITTFVLQQSLC